MLLELEDVSFTYMEGTPLAQTALRDINVSIQEGEFVGLIGPTGSGKSTLIQHFNGLLIPTRGKVFVEDKEVGVEIKPAETRQKMGLVFQFPENQLFEESVFGDVAFGPRNLGCSEEEIEVRVKKSLEFVGLDYDSFKNRSPFSLSGGEMRRVAIAGVLAMEPKMLILDEPTSGLDSQGREEILSRLEHLHHTESLTIVLVSHDMDEVAHLADRLIVLNEGRILFNDEPRRIFSQAQKLREIGLGVPHVTSLFMSLIDRGMKVPSSLFEVEQAADVIVDMFEEMVR